MKISKLAITIMLNTMVISKNWWIRHLSLLLTQFSPEIWKMLRFRKIGEVTISNAEYYDNSQNRWFWHLSLLLPQFSS